MTQLSARTEPVENFYEIDDEIGRGQYAVVKSCVEKSTRRQYAAKFVRKRRKGKDCKAEVWHEVEVLRSTNYPVQHSKIIKLYEVFETRNEIVLILELALGGDLHRHCVAYDSDEPSSSRSEKEVVYLLRQILEGIRHLHDQDYIHLDIKPNNILLMTEEPYPDIRIIDFGFAKNVKPGEQICIIVGTPDYVAFGTSSEYVVQYGEEIIAARRSLIWVQVAPEILQFEPVGKPSDIWSIGVVAYVMLTGMSPFAGDDKQETCYNVSLGNVEFPESYFKNISYTAQDFIRRVLQSEPEARMTAEECLSHPWLNTEELFQISPLRRSRRANRLESKENSCNIECTRKRKKLQKLQQQNGTAEDAVVRSVVGTKS